MRVEFRKPEGPLARYVRVLWWFESDEFAHHEERIVPDGSLQLLINLDRDALNYRNDGGAPKVNLSGVAFDGIFSRPIMRELAASAALLFNPAHEGAPSFGP